MMRIVMSSSFRLVRSADSVDGQMSLRLQAGITIIQQRFYGRVTAWIKK